MAELMRLSKVEIDSILNFWSEIGEMKIFSLDFETKSAKLARFGTRKIY